MTLTLDSIVVADPDVLAADMGEGMVLMDLESGLYFDFQAVAGEIWLELAAPRRIGAICQGLEAAYDAPPERIRASVLSFLEDLLRRGLIRTA